MLRITQLSGEELTCLPLTELSDVKALKQRLHEQHGLPPRFRQTLLHEGNTLDDAVKLETEMDLQLLIVAFSEPSGDQGRELRAAAWGDRLAEARRALKTSPESLKLTHCALPQSTTSCETLELCHFRVFVTKPPTLSQALRLKLCCSSPWTRMLFLQMT